MNKSNLQLFELQLNQAGEAPRRIQILPAGSRIQGRDGRTYHLSDPQGLVTRFNNRKEPVPVDYEHGSELKPRLGEKAPAAGWVNSLEHDPQGGVFAHVEWTPTAEGEIKERAYRYISPAVWQSQCGEIKAISSLGLTHKPNLELVALNRKDDAMDDEDKKQPNEAPAYLAELGLEADASPDQITEAVKALKAKGEEKPEDDETQDKPAEDSPALNSVVPRADYDQLAGKVTTLEKQLADMSASAHSEKVELALNSALNAGQIAPASVEFYRQSCMQEGGLEAFNKFLKTAPSLGGGRLGGDLLSLSLNNRQVLTDQETETPGYQRIKEQLGIADKPQPNKGA